MIITRTPLRVSFIGGGTDVPAWYERYGYGQVYAAAISLYVNVIVAPHHAPGRYRIAYSTVEDVDSIDHISHDRLRCALRRTGVVTGGVEIHTIADIPGRGSGLGSSSAMLVGALKALSEWQGQHRNWEQIAEQAAAVEIEDLKTGAGKQDAYIASFGGAATFEFENTEPIVKLWAPYLAQAITDKWSKWMPLFYTGMVRDAGPSLKALESRIGTPEVDEAMITTLGLIHDLRNAMFDCDFAAVGKLLDQAWSLKKKANPAATTPEISAMYKRAMDAGALGGKLCGAGGGGYLMLVVPPRRWGAVAEALYRKPIAVQYGVGGSHTILGERRHD